MKSFPLVFKSEHTLYLSFLILMILRRLERIQFKPELPFSSEFLEKFSARVQIKTRALPFFFIFHS